jgi:hypothetical protein
MSVKDSIPESTNFWDDPAFQDRLVALLIQDYPTLRNCALFLSADDFKPSKGVPNGHARWTTAWRALEYFEKHGAPIGTLIRADVLDYAAQINMGSMQINGLLEYIKNIQSIKVTAPDFLVDKVIQFKSNIAKKEAINELADLLSSGQLLDEKWDEISRRVQEINTKSQIKTTDYLAGLENRIQRRAMGNRHISTPQTLIDPLDALIHRTVGPKQVGLIIAPFKRGKSTMLLWLAIALSLQRFNVLFVTLEDTLSLVEDRMDSIVTAFMGRAISLDNLAKMPKTLRQRFERFKNLIHSQIHVYDGVGTNMTITMLERVIRSKRNEGFIPHAIVVDYDDKLKSSQNFKDKRMESDDVYNDFGNLCGQYNLIGWIAAQTQRGTRHLKILSGDRVAEDIGKARKCTCCISMGKGDPEWGDQSIYLWVAAHKTDRMEVGCHIVPDLDRALIYDREATSRAMKRNSTTP